MAVVTHPHVIRDAVRFGSALVADLHSDRALRLFRRIANTPLVDQVSYAHNVTVERACPLTLFNGQHVTHHTFGGDCADAVNHFYRFPADADPDAIRAWFDENGIQVDPVHCYHDYDCCGHWYTNGSYTYRNARHGTLVCINWYRNV